MLNINIKSQIAVNQIRNIWRIRNPKLYYLHHIVMSQLEGINYYIKYIPDRKNEEVKTLSDQAKLEREISQS